ncbi:pseudouridine-metabolizing bifunctional protein C1861.05 [Nematostella vectensis]|uniref:pseudouridine-metabolizing bifunctional protein C1861.05 n=1 Tax=Nematostella vectensis TaxID=45351 RepID=UPI0020772ABB|nr:pseudouridine-metabolizing bifunctional protein C1861.05 [Nematostella vectensis]
MWRSLLKALNTRHPGFRCLSFTPLGASPQLSPELLSKKVIQPLLQVHPEVADAITLKNPVVALESTIITHGMPYPENLKMARDVCGVVRDNGAVPATIAILDGQIHVGLTDDKLKKLAQAGQNAVKTSRRDLPYVLSKGLMGGTTVSGTMIAAHKAGIPVFVTGGIGGVHRGAQESFDVSADLTELGRTPIAVVCAGAKSILDIQLTLEYLETQGVTVATFGETVNFPAFFTSDSGYKSSCSVLNASEAAAMINCNLTFGVGSGMVIAVPIPSGYAASGAEIEKAIQQALEEARSANITGKESTPFVLKRVNELTGGKSLEANIALVKHNAKIGSQIAVELSKLRQPNIAESAPIRGSSKKSAAKSDDLGAQIKKFRPVVIGGANVDFIATAKEIVPEASNSGKVRMSFGGVGRNIAEGLSRLGMKPVFVSAVGGDSLGALLLRHCEEFRLTKQGIQTFQQCETGTYSAIISEDGSFHAAVGDMEIHDKISQEMIAGYEESIKNAPIVVVDANVSRSGLDYVLNLCSEQSIPVWFEPTCIMKAGIPFETDCWKHITYASPNLKELRTMSDAAVKHHKLPRHPRFGENSEAVASSNSSRNLDDIIEECLLLAQPLLAHIHCLVVTLGKNGVLVLRDTTADLPFPSKKNPRTPAMHHGLVSAVHYPAPDVHVINVTGAGDSMTAAMVMSIILGHAPDDCVKLGLVAAYHSLQSKDAIAKSLSRSSFTVDSVPQVKDCIPRSIDIDHVR